MTDVRTVLGAGRSPEAALGIGAHARREVPVAIDEIRRRVPGLRSGSEPDELRNHFTDRIERLPCAW